MSADAATDVIPAAGAGLGAVTVTLTGSILGIHYDVLTVAMFGGLIALLHLPPMPGLVRKFASVAAAALVGGLLSPVAAGAAVQYAPVIVNHAGPTAVKLACAFVLGLIAQPAIPIGFELLKRFGGRA